MDAAITITADDFRLLIGQPEIDENGIGDFAVRLDYLGGSFGIENCTLWPNSDFAEQLQAMHGNSASKAAYQDMNHDFAMVLRGIGKGHIELKVDLVRRGTQGELAVMAQTVIDQSYLPALIAAWRRHFVTRPTGNR